MTCLAPRSPTPGRLEGLAWLQAPPDPSQGEQQGRRGTHHAAAAGSGRGGVSSTVQGAQEEGGRGKGMERERLDLWAAVLPGEGEWRHVQHLAGEGDLVCLSSCLTSADPSAVP